MINETALIDANNAAANAATWAWQHAMIKGLGKAEGDNVYNKAYQDAFILTYGGQPLGDSGMEDLWLLFQEKKLTFPNLICQMISRVRKNNQPE